MRSKGKLDRWGGRVPGHVVTGAKRQARVMGEREEVGGLDEMRVRGGNQPDFDHKTSCLLTL